MGEIRNIIYKAKNEQRKCFYIGQSIRGLNVRKYSHKNECFIKKKKFKFYNFLRKYGWDSFDWEILAVYSTPEELPQAEIDWLKKQKEELLKWECLNSTEGGKGNLGWKIPKETVEKMKKNHKGTIGKHYTEASKQLQSISTKLYYQHHPEEKEKLSKNLKTYLKNHPGEASRRGKKSWITRRENLGKNV